MDEKREMYRIDSLEKRTEKNETVIDDLKQDVATMAANIAAIFKRIDTIEGSFQWINRAVIGTLITGVLGAVISMLFNVFKG